jgi:hypothetical protein
MRPSVLISGCQSGGRWNRLVNAWGDKCSAATAGKWLSTRKAGRRWGLKLRAMPLLELKKPPEGGFLLPR